MAASARYTMRVTSFEALDSMASPDAVIIDGDHNYYTVTGELQRIHRRGPDAASPLVMLHDVGWPLVRRDRLPRPRPDTGGVPPAAVSRPWPLPGAELRR
jgi:hypothetical protein